MLFTCTLVLTCPVGQGGFECETWAVESKHQDTGWAKTNKKNAHRREQQEPQSNPGSRPLSMYSRGAPRRWPSSRYKLWLHNNAIERNCHELFVTCYPWLIMIILCYRGRCAILIDVHFSQVKNKPWLPWVYSWIWHHRKQLKAKEVSTVQCLYLCLWVCLGCWVGDTCARLLK
jgi:hypothetical protein